MRMYDQKQFHHQDVARKRYERLCLEVEGFEKLNAEIARISVLAARALLNDDDKLAASYKKQAEQVQAEKESLLKKAGFDPDYEQPPYECGDCRDTGFVDGKKCHCFRKAAVDLLYREAQMTPGMEDADFSRFSLDYYDRTRKDDRGHCAADYAARAGQICRQFTEVFNTPDQIPGLLLYGDVGVGKTFLTACVAKELIAREYFVLYFSAVRFFDTMADGTFGRGDGIKGTLYEYISRCDLLIVDDLGTELSNNFTATQLFSCINERLLAKKPVIISTNLSLDSLKNLYTERTFSRITSSYTLLPIYGEDIRLKKRFESI